MRTNFQTVTPDVAAGLLLRNTRNRPASNMVVQSYARMMRAGEWQPENGETIKIASDGTLLDGQQRLMAIVETGIPIKMLVVSELSPESFHTIDTGKARTAGDIVGMAGIANAHTMAAAAGFLYNLLEDRSISRNEIRPSKAWIFEFVQKNNEALQSSLAVVRGRVGMMLVSASLAVALHFAFVAKSKHPDARALADRFFEQLKSGENLDANSPVHVLRERLILNRSARFKALTSVLAAWSIKAWNAYSRDTGIKQLKWAVDEQFPSIK